ncbi:hypothetical protein ASZ90_015953 [hydrocarbon metagenome]|uniref:Uncharacterized protein n=1 Tax=hydrocarbon metagenome TaxID=938273 RepID=A0A0W8F0H3_9ZZZZ
MSPVDIGGRLPGHVFPARLPVMQARFCRLRPAGDTHTLMTTFLNVSAHPLSLH